MIHWLQRQWLKITPWHILLLPISLLFWAIVFLRKALYKLGILTSTRLPVPVIIVGNISVGGTGKTPFVIWLAEQLKAKHYQVGIISRGYGGTTTQIAEVFSHSNPLEVGDEPVLIAKRTACPTFVGANRVAAGQALLNTHPHCNIIISDDGLQHYRLQRDVEIALINSDSFGNQQLLPAGPLREGMTRLQSVDAIVDSSVVNHVQVNQLPPRFNMQLQGSLFERVNNEIEQQPASYFAGEAIVAIAGIGNPARFFKKLADLGLQFEQKTFADHHAFTAQDLMPFSSKIILMTEKDAVKCQAFAKENAWYLPVKAEITSANNLTLINQILHKFT